ncbi:MAG: hypothetical protein HY819_06490 [Acidobacteria bacterium]|nr:hypothetical protein [Acidobacteriota bacterium]
MVDSSKPAHSRIGEEIEAPCGRCRMDRIHRIVAQDPDGSIKKIICGMCNSYRSYRQPKAQSETGTKVAKVRSSSSRSTTTAAEDFGLPSRNYNMRENYDVGEVIGHSTFGVGKVLSIKDMNKIEVKFSDGIKVLLQNK